MKKLLHERLRNRTRIEQGCVETDSGVTITALNKNEMLALADEIEKYYIPRPRFEDGEPCNIGDEVEFPQPAGVKKVLSFIAGEDGITFANVGMSSGPVVIYAGKVNRPKPKVLDSLEKLRDDMIDLCGTDGEDSSLICDELADCAARLTALIERGA